MTAAPWLDAGARVARSATRSLARSPGLTGVAVLTLALATGAATAIFSIVHGVLLRPLPLASPERLVQIEQIAQVGGAGPVRAADVDEFRRQSRTIEALTAHSLTVQHLVGDGEPERVTTAVVDREFFPVLGAPPLLGRTFSATDSGALAVISERLWARRFNRAAAFSSTPIALEGNVFDPAQQRVVIRRADYTVVGVMPDLFQFPYRAASLYPAALPETRVDLWLLLDRPRTAGRVPVTARLRPGVTLADARHELTAIGERLGAIAPAAAPPAGVRVVALADGIVSSARPMLWLLGTAAALALLAACINVAGLQVARMTVRLRDVVMRAALGASRARLCVEVLAENLVLAIGGGALGLAVAWWSLRLLTAVGAAKIPRAHEIALDWTAFAFMLAVTVASGVLSGLAPVALALRADLRTLTRDGGGHATAGRRHARAREGLIVVQIAVSFVLALAAGLVMRELARLAERDAGFATDRVLTLHVTPRLDAERYFRIEERLRQVPGIEAAGLVHMLPLQNWAGIGTFQIRGRNADEPSRLPVAELRAVTPGYFDTLRIPIRSGRALTDRDAAARPVAVVVNETLARRYFPGENPIGRELDRGVIVGVAGDIREKRLDADPEPQIYSIVNPASGIAPDIGMAVVARTAGDPLASLDAIKAALREAAPAAAVFNVRTMEQIVAESLWELNLYRWLIGLFAGLALVLTAIGLFGVAACGAAARTREFAIRLALGSNQARLARTVIGRGLALAAIGLAAGGAAAAAMMGVLTSVAGTGAGEPSIVAATAALLVAIALGAAALPAWRVTTLQPVAILRND